ncbi:holin [Rhodococcus sp. T2V]|uniref:holin n=1 Tax=Rhodococcus sp. T2V TaxID=3034164 RepID=UPI0023E29873|nr:holin [Rhodococcus sp. T2V]MDF3308704.1 holin [Rhodococcus sp. T2V]
MGDHEYIEPSIELGSLDTKAFWLDALDRAGRSFLQNVLVFFGAGVTIVSVSWTSLLGAAALAAVVSLILAVSTATAVTSGNFLVDLADRAVRTGAGSLAAAFPVTGSILDIDWPASLTIAGTAVLLSVVTSLLAENRGSAKGLPSLAPVDRVTVPPVINPTGGVTELRGD